MKPLHLLPRHLPYLFFVLVNLVAGPVYANCTSPVGKEADIIYNSGYSTYQFCDGTNWQAYGAGANCLPPNTYSPTVPAGFGYFVLTSTTYNGNLGGFLGADAKCLTELATTHTGWKGYATANANGQLVASKVHAFLCGIGWCTNLMPLTTYYFANAGNSAAGGASFTTDSNGVGPGDAANWSAANYFSGDYNPWSGRSDNGSQNTATSWCLSNDNGYDCVEWTDGTSSNFGDIARTANLDQQRWGVNVSGNACNNTRPLFCFVNP